ncbi:MAG: hypothetical protein KDB00_14070 [Planctomycetales bacterium]|nr:hypothetical protein [Planctomycetales bacterium]
MDHPQVERSFLVMSTTISTRRFPSAIEGKLRSVRWRHAALAIAFAVSFSIGILLVLMVLSMVIDWLFPFAPFGLRWAMTAGTLVAAVATAAWLGIAPVRRALHWHRAANAVDGDIPELEERWSTVASLSARNRSNDSPVQQAMASQVISEAIAMERIVQPRRVAPPVSLRPALIVASIGIALLTILYLLNPPQTSVLLHRFWSPLSNITATQLTSVTGDQFVPRGDSVELVTELVGVPRSNATLTVSHTDGSIETYRLRPNDAAPETFVQAIRVDESLSYRVRAGDAQTPWHQLNVIDFPELEQIQFTVDFPEYTDRKRVESDRLPRRVKVTQGSMLHLAMKPLLPLKELSLALSDPNQSVATRSEEPTEQIQILRPDSEGWYRFEMQLIDDVLLRPSLLSEHDLENQRRLFSRIDVVVDKAPVARVITPSDELAVAEDEVIEIEFEAHDDHGIMKAELVVFDESQKDADGNAKVLEVREIPLDDQAMQKHLLAKTQLDLKKLDIKEGQEISYAIRVTDNRMLNLSDQKLSAPNSSLAGQQNPQQQKDQKQKDSDGAAQGQNADRSEPRERSGADLTKMTELLAEQNENPSSAEDSMAEPSTDDTTVKPGQNSTAEPDKTLSNKLANSQDSAGNEPVPTGQPRKASGERQDSDLDAVASNDAPADQQANSEAEMSSDATGIAEDDPKIAHADTDKAGMDVDNGRPGENAEAQTDARKNGSLASNATTKTGNNQPNSNQPNSNQPNTNPANSNRPNANTATPRPAARNSSPAAANLASVQPQKPNNTSIPNGTMLTGQRSRMGQNVVTNRRRLKITDKLSAIAEAENRPGEENDIREQVVKIDEMLAEIETGLQKLVDHKIADSDRGEQFRRLDQGLGNVETFVADLREQTKENQFAFVGLQMVDITRTHVTPARDRVFASSHRPGASDVDAKMGLQHIVRARELLAALLKRYDRVEQEKKLEKEMKEAFTIYEVYVEKRRMLMREARQNLNPMQRKMGIIEVDQEYLDRLAEVLKLRREMMEEFAQMLGDDPRLLSRYMELVKRQQRSLRDQLTEISQRQFDLTEESMSWLQIDESQRSEYWTIITELRLITAGELAKDAAELAERVEKQMPLDIEAVSGTPADVIAQAKAIAQAARTISFDAENLMTPNTSDTDPGSAGENAPSLITQCERLFSFLDRLQFENEGNEGIALYVDSRIQETRAVADQANVWAALRDSIAGDSYAGLLETEQHRLSIATQVLRVEMLEMETDLAAQFQRLVDSDLPGEIKDMIRQLHGLMESATFNQIAASYRAEREQLESASKQQQLATQRLTQAEELFDKIRRAVVDRLDENDPDDPNIADLQDPTLDEFLARLEREPSIATQLGIPNRRTNLRIRADAMLWQQSQLGGLGASQSAAAARAERAKKMRRETEQESPPKGKKITDKEQMSDEQRQQREQEDKAQEMLAKTLAEIEKQRADENVPDDVRKRLDQMAENLKQMMERDQNDESARRAWERFVQTDEAQTLMRAVSSGESLADEQWNRLLSTLDDGLWQVKGNRPPEAYRKAIEQYQDQIRSLMQTIDEG